MPTAFNAIIVPGQNYSYSLCAGEAGVIRLDNFNPNDVNALNLYYFSTILASNTVLNSVITPCGATLVYNSPNTATLLATQYDTLTLNIIDTLGNSFISTVYLTLTNPNLANIQNKQVPSMDSLLVVPCAFMRSIVLNGKHGNAHYVATHNPNCMSSGFMISDIFYTPEAGFTGLDTFIIGNVDDFIIPMDDPCGGAQDQRTTQCENYSIYVVEVLLTIDMIACNNDAPTDFAFDYTIAADTLPTQHNLSMPCIGGTGIIRKAADFRGNMVSYTHTNSNNINATIQFTNNILIYDTPPILSMSPMLYDTVVIKFVDIYNNTYYHSINIVIQNNTFSNPTTLATSSNQSVVVFAQLPMLWGPSITVPRNGTLQYVTDTINYTNQVTYVPNLGFIGSDTIYTRYYTDYIQMFCIDGIELTNIDMQCNSYNAFIINVLPVVSNCNNPEPTNFAFDYNLSNAPSNASMCLGGTGILRKPMSIAGNITGYTHTNISLNATIQLTNNVLIYDTPPTLSTTVTMYDTVYIQVVSSMINCVSFSIYPIYITIQNNTFTNPSIVVTTANQPVVVLPQIPFAWGPSITAPHNGTLQYVADTIQYTNQVSYVPNPGFIGDDTIYTRYGTDYIQMFCVDGIELTNIDMECSGYNAIIIHVGNTGVSSTTGTVSNSLYPNPSSNGIFSSKDNIENYVVYDVTGKIVAQNKALFSTTLDISSLAAGAYFVTVNNQKVEKIIISK